MLELLVVGCLRMHSGGLTRHASQVVLHVYDMAWVNEYIAWAGLGVFHSGLVVNGDEYTFGGHPEASTGVFSAPPGEAPGCVFRQAILLGESSLSHTQIRDTISSLSASFLGSDYNLLTNNCNHFTDALATALTGQHIPAWVNRLATLGSWLPCLLPPGLAPPPPPDSADPFVAFAGQGRSLADPPPTSDSAPAASTAAASTAAASAGAGGGGGGGGNGGEGEDERRARREKMAAAAMARFGGQ